ncbi:methyl-accepting chemotaxis protein [Actimicrobium sp. CCI2.3]|uniref:methyl-accepting chemotaxis protein n=1 Tax=Actimicrobium sp. CCI2.3 TaxID=3048616 RepID=UPI002AB33B4E|nr:methyl-accepting chemotaxis protein [Actimicrobium sp. CCI2.3]MDY7574817.1 methyl-accepting chemotaxis protein [Actimicrobium sp. CCI2.3]MEB0020222.1 methyl-accepting chemotaxis protein [Actimicrobium sp. CCI2.3]
MAYPASRLQESAQTAWHWYCRRTSAVAPAWQVIAAGLAALLLGRVLPADTLQTSDGWLGRPGDSLLLLAVLVMTAGALLAWRSSSQRLPAETNLDAQIHPAQAALTAHLRLDQTINDKLDEIVSDTENSALAIIGDVRRLYDSASTLVTYLDGSSIKASDIGNEITDSVEFLVGIGTFIEQLPVTMARDLASVEEVAKEIRAMGGLVAAVHAISMQSHLLAINAAIEATRAGASGAAFKIIAEEMRTLAANSGTVADQIGKGLKRARFVVEDGMAASIADSSQRLTEVSLAAASILKLQENFEDMTQYYKTRFVVVTKYNVDLAREIADVLGQIQYQDVVRQTIERLQFASAERNAILVTAVEQIALDPAGLAHLPGELEAVTDRYASEEEKHKHSGRHRVDDTSDLKIELF